VIDAVLAIIAEWTVLARKPHEAYTCLIGLGFKLGHFQIARPVVEQPSAFLEVLHVRCTLAASK